MQDPAKAGRVPGTAIARYRRLQAWHHAHDAQLKSLRKLVNESDRQRAERAEAQMARIRASLKVLHDDYLAKLSADLTPVQVSRVTDKMTHYQMEATYSAYCAIVPDLTAAQKARMLTLLKQVSEEAMDCGSNRAADDVFRRYKGRSNDYLTAQGRNVGRPFKVWGQRQRQKRQAAKTH